MGNYSEYIAAARGIGDELRAFRASLHRRAELSFKEYRTQEYIISVLDKYGFSWRKIAGTGVLVTLEGKGDTKRAVVLRADIDALPIHENTGLPFASEQGGVMHACGHDMHAAALLGALIVLKKKLDFSGTVLGLFQPGEELCPGGASLVMAERPFDGYEITAFIGEHVDADIPVGQLGIRAGKYMASSDELRITVRGSGGHAAMPHKLADPVVAAAQVVTSLQQVASRNAEAAVPTVLTIGKVIANGATNVVPDTVYMEGTFRTMNEAWRAKAKKRIREIVTGVCVAYGVTADTDIADGYPSVYNDETLAARAKRIMQQMWGADKVHDLDIRMTSEDFGYYTTAYPAVFYRLGTAKPGGEPTGALHTSVFNPDENALETGASTMAALADGLGRKI